MGQVAWVAVSDIAQDIRHPIRGIKVIAGREKEKNIPDKINDALSRPSQSETAEQASALNAYKGPIKKHFLFTDIR